MRTNDLTEMQYELTGYVRMLKAAQSNMRLPQNARRNMLNAEAHIESAERELGMAKALIAEAREQAGAA